MTRGAVALATCRELPDGPEGRESEDDLAELLGATWVPWDDPPADWSRFDAVVVRSVWDYLDRRDEFLAWARGVPRLFNSAGTLAWNTDKRYLADLAADGLPVVPTQFVGPDDAPGPLPAGDYVVKPAVSAGARHTARFGPGDQDAARALLAVIARSGRTAMVQPYVASVDERGESALVFFDGVLSHALEKRVLLARAEPPAEEISGPEEIAPYEPSVAEREVGERALAHVAERFGMPLYARVDLVTGEAGEPLVLEIELTEPALWSAHFPGATERFAEAIRGRLP